MKVTDPTLGKTVPASLVIVPSARRALSDGGGQRARLWKLASLLRGPEAVRSRGGRPVAARHALPAHALRRVVGGRRAVRKEGQGQGEGCRGVQQGPLLLEALQRRTEEGAVVRAGSSRLPTTWHICSGIDVGTGGTRALVIDERGRIVASATSEHAPFASPQTGWAEQDPRDWWRATSEAVRAVLRRPGVGGGLDRRHRLLRPDARLVAARREGRRRAPGAALVRSADRRGVPRDHRAHRRARA